MRMHRMMDARLGERCANAGRPGARMRRSAPAEGFQAAETGLNDQSRGKIHQWLPDFL
jgi:hypothetical protein